MEDGAPGGNAELTEGVTGYGSLEAAATAVLATADRTATDGAAETGCIHQATQNYK